MDHLSRRRADRHRSERGTLDPGVLEARLEADQYDIFVIEQKWRRWSTHPPGCYEDPRPTANLRRGWIVPTPDGRRRSNPIRSSSGQHHGQGSSGTAPEMSRDSGHPRHRQQSQLRDPAGALGAVDPSVASADRSDQGRRLHRPTARREGLDPLESGGDHRAERRNTPSRSRLDQGIAIYPPNVPNPARLPILGLRALIRNGLKLTIDGATRELTPRIPSRLTRRDRSRPPTTVTFHSQMRTLDKPAMDRRLRVWD